MQTHDPRDYSQSPTLDSVILEGLTGALSRAQTFADALAYANRDADFSVTTGLRVPLAAALLGTRPVDKQVLLVVTATGREAEGLRSALHGVSPSAEIIEFPAWETLPHERLSPSPEIVGKRLADLPAGSRCQATLTGPLGVGTTPLA